MVRVPLGVASYFPSGTFCKEHHTYLSCIDSGLEHKCLAVPEVLDCSLLETREVGPGASIWLFWFIGSFCL